MKRAKSIGELRMELSFLEEADSAVDADVERLWIEEAQRRYDAFLGGELEARAGDDVMRAARDQLK